MCMFVVLMMTKMRVRLMVKGEGNGVREKEEEGNQRKEEKVGGERISLKGVKEGKGRK